MISDESRYRNCILYRDAVSGDFLGARPRIDTSVQPDDRYHVVRASDRIDALAFRYFGRVDLWWVIADYNDIFFPLDLEIGATLRIPTLEHVMMRFLA